jgi:Icc-related predicted phosphoesterase
MVNKVRIAAVSDLHGMLPPIPDCDILLIAGDICPLSDHSPFGQMKWLQSSFEKWLDEIPAKEVVAVAGNHDWIFQKMPHMVPRLRWRYLQDSGCGIEGLKVWGTPWQPPFFDWAFNMEEEGLRRKWSLIPDDTDILVTHSPPFGYGDEALRKLTDENKEKWPDTEHTGSPSLTEKIKELPNLKLHVFGHIHRGYGRYEIGSKIVANVSLVNEKYQPVNEVMVFDI